MTDCVDLVPLDVFLVHCYNSIVTCFLGPATAGMPHVITLVMLCGAPLMSGGMHNNHLPSNYPNGQTSQLSWLPSTVNHISSILKYVWGNLLTSLPSQYNGATSLMALAIREVANWHC